MAERLKEGDIFYVRYRGKYFFGKLLIDVSERIPLRNVSMKFYHDCYLIPIEKVGICFRCGELQLPTKLIQKDFLDKYDIQRQVHFWYSTALMMACNYQGRDDLMEFLPYAFLEREDLRFAEPQRKEVYKQIGEDVNISYYELALKNGFDLARFYK